MACPPGSFAKNMAAAIARQCPIQCSVGRSVTTRSAIDSIRLARSASAALSSCAASSAVEWFEPHTTMPASNAVIAASNSRGSKDRRPSNTAREQNGARHDGNARDQDEFAAALELGGKFVDLRLKALDLTVRVVLARILIGHAYSIHDGRTR